MLKQALALVGLTLSLSANAATFNGFNIDFNNGQLNLNVELLEGNTGTRVGQTPQWEYTLNDVKDITWTISEGYLGTVWEGREDWNDRQGQNISFTLNDSRDELINLNAITNYMCLGSCPAGTTDQIEVKHQAAYVWRSVIGSHLSDIDAIYSPVITLSAVPIPAAAYLFLTALTGLFGISRRGKRS